MVAGPPEREDDDPWSYDQLTDAGRRRRNRAAVGSCSPRGWPASAPPSTTAAARAGFHNLSLRTTRAELARAVMEGVAFNSRWLSEAVERFTGRRFDAIRVIGGGRDVGPVVLDLRRRPRPARRAGGRAGARQPPGQLPCWPAWRWAWWSRRSSARWCRWRPPTTPSRPHVGGYDRLFSVFPALYPAQKEHVQAAQSEVVSCARPR